MKSYLTGRRGNFFIHETKIESQGIVSMDRLCFAVRSLQKPRFIPVL